MKTAQNLALLGQLRQRTLVDFQLYAESIGHEEIAREDILRLEIVFTILAKRLEALN